MDYSFPETGNLQGRNCRRTCIIKQKWYNSITEIKLIAEVILGTCARVVSTKYCGETFSEVLIYLFSQKIRLKHKLSVSCHSNFSFKFSAAS